MKRVHSNTPDRKLAVRASRWDKADLLRGRADLLTGKDKALMTMYLEHGNSFRQMARVAGVTEVTIARRIRKLTDRLIDGHYITCLRSRGKFTALEMTVARDYFLTGLSMKNIAAKRHSTFYRIRKMLEKIRLVVTAAEQQGLAPNMNRSNQVDR
jgi:predicted DNA-binding protein YlxM (UPF0122 family)